MSKIETLIGVQSTTVSTEDWTDSGIIRKLNKDDIRGTGSRSNLIQIQSYSIKFLFMQLFIIPDTEAVACVHLNHVKLTEFNGTVAS